MSSEGKPLEITPETRVGTLLDAYPQLEDTLVGLAPAFGKLSNPVLRKTVAKVTTLRQAAKVGNVSLATLIDSLRNAAGQTRAALAEDEGSGVDKVPDWYREPAISRRLDARPLIASGERPVSVVMSYVSKLEDGQIFELTTPFVPAPLIDMARQKGLEVWFRQDEPEIVKTFFLRPRKR